MAPFIDLINRANDEFENAAVHTTAGGPKVGVASVREIKQGEEVTISYGSLPLGKGAALWGFTLEGPKMDPLPLTYGMLMARRPADSMDEMSTIGAWGKDLDMVQRARERLECGQGMNQVPVKPLVSIMACTRAMFITPEVMTTIRGTGISIEALDFQSPFDYFIEVYALSATYDAINRASNAPPLASLDCKASKPSLVSSVLCKELRYLREYADEVLQMHQMLHESRRLVLPRSTKPVAAA